MLHRFDLQLILIGDLIFDKTPLAVGIRISL